MRDRVTHARGGARNGSQVGDLVGGVLGAGFSRSDRSARVARTAIT
jgi:hypothetical protein